MMSLFALCVSILPRRFWTLSLTVFRASVARDLHLGHMTCGETLGTLDHNFDDKMIYHVNEIEVLHYECLLCANYLFVDVVFFNLSILQLAEKVEVESPAIPRGSIVSLSVRDSY